jgi:hypothetical protein
MLRLRKAFIADIGKTNLRAAGEIFGGLRPVLPDFLLFLRLLSPLPKELFVFTVVGFTAQVCA